MKKVTFYFFLFLLSSIITLLSAKNNLGTTCSGNPLKLNYYLVNCYFQDSSNNYWLGTDQGIYILSTINKTYFDLTQTSLNGQNLKSIYCNTNGQIICKSDHDSLVYNGTYFINPNKREEVLFPSYSTNLGLQVTNSDSYNRNEFIKVNTNLTSKIKEILGESHPSDQINFLEGIQRSKSHHSELVYTNSYYNNNLLVIHTKSDPILYICDKADINLPNRIDSGFYSLISSKINNSPKRFKYIEYILD